MAKTVSKKVWMPKNFAKDGETIYYMSALHRGDMYHIRAAMQLAHRSVYLFDAPKSASPSTQAVVDYLARSALKNKNHIFAAPWNMAAAESRTKPKKPDGTDYGASDYSLDQGKTTPGELVRQSISSISERGATAEIEQVTPMHKAILDGMAILEPASVTKLKNDFADLFKNTWKIKADKPRILIMYRDSGAVSGVYPELDSGPAIIEINDLLSNFPEKGGSKLKLLTAGNKTKVSDIETIGEYWTDLKPKIPKGETARDVEAYFMKWAHDNGYFKMGLSFRSGALDLLTFMGIPTVSISLRNVAGEPRHEQLAKEDYKRMNIQYDQPRHATTAWIKARNKGDIYLFSPYWQGTKPDDINPGRTLPTSEDEKKKQQAQEPRKFGIFDTKVIDVGLKEACRKYLGWTKAVDKLSTNMRLAVTDTHATRYLFPSGLSGDKKQEYFDKLKALDVEDLQSRKGRANELQESTEWFDNYQKSSQGDWTAVYQLLEN